MKALVLIGGRGTRLRPLTLSTPKPLLPLANKPFLRYQLDVLRGHVDEVLLCAADPAPFRRALGERSAGLKLRYLSETRPLGTAGAVKNAAPLLGREAAFLVFNGDVLNNLDITALLKAHRRSGALATVALTRVPDPTLYGLVRVSSAGRVKQFVEKPSADEADTNVVNAGVYLFSRDIFQVMDSESPSLERDIFPRLIAMSQLGSHETKGYWIDIGTLDRYLQVHLDLLSGRTGLPLPKGLRASLDGGRVAVGDGTRIDATARFSGNVSVGARCRIGAGATLRDCVVLDGTRVGDNARLEHCVIGPRCSLGERAEVGSGTALAGGSRVEAYSRL